MDLPAEVQREIELKGHKIDLSLVFPLLTKDWKVLGKSGITPARLANGQGDVEALGAYVLFVLRKADSSVQEQEIDNLPFTQLLKLLRQLGDYEKSVDVLDFPFSTASTSSPGPTTGT
jgi:hypothetical protein